MNGRLQPLSFDDPAWAAFRGGYRIAYDPRKALQAFEVQRDASEAWKELWSELHHQGDIGEASYAAVPHIVRIYAHRGVPDWNAYALVAVIEEARNNGRNPALPSFLQGAYEEALRQLGELGLRELAAADDPNLICSIIAVISIWKHQPVLGRIALLDETERLEMLGELGYG